jgi:hypothetical protein
MFRKCCPRSLDTIKTGQDSEEHIDIVWQASKISIQISHFVSQPGCHGVTVNEGTIKETPVIFSSKSAKHINMLLGNV